MRIPVLMLIVSLAWPAFAQVTVVIPPPPTITFQVAPPLVEVQPGVQVVEDHAIEEIFYTAGWYWVRRGKHWYRTSDHRGGWAVVEGEGVPAVLVRAPKGRYKHFKAKKAVMVTPTGEVVKVKYKKEKKQKH